MNICISDEVFSRFPNYRRGLVIARCIRNGAAPDELTAALRAAESTLAGQLTPENLISQPRIEAWREAYRALGVKPSEYRPSVEALARRVLKHDPLPAINTVVDMGNLVSIQHLVPVGAHAIDVLQGDMELRLASGAETFEPFGSDAVEHPNRGEIVFVEGNTVLTRRWTWRQAKHTLVVPETTAIEFNVDALPPVSDDEVERICIEVSELLQKYCGGETCQALLSRNNPTLAL